MDLWRRAAEPQWVRSWNGSRVLTRSLNEQCEEHVRCPSYTRVSVLVSEMRLRVGSHHTTMNRPVLLCTRLHTEFEPRGLTPDRVHRIPLSCASSCRGLACWPPVMGMPVPSHQGSPLHVLCPLTFGNSESLCLKFMGNYWLIFHIVRNISLFLKTLVIIAMDTAKNKGIDTKKRK